MSNFKNKTAVVTGGAEGIGFSIAKALGEQGMNIVLTDIDENNLNSAANKLKTLGIPTHSVLLDVSDEEQWQQVAKKSIEQFGKVHMVVNNAGVGGDSGPVDTQDAKGWQWAIDVNLMGVVFGAKTIVPLIKEHGEGGWILNVASMAGMGGVPYSAAYNATKAAVIAISEGWSEELKDKNINVSVLCPAFVKTRIYDSERNRPEKYKLSHDDGEAENSFSKKSKAMVESGIDVSIVASRVIEALLNNELYIFTHPNYRQLVQKRFKDIDDAFINSEKSPHLKDILNKKLDML